MKIGTRMDRTLSRHSPTEVSKTATARRHLPARWTLAVLVTSAMVAAGSPAVATAASRSFHQRSASSRSIPTFTFGREGSLLTRSYNPDNPNWVQFLTNVSLMQLAFPYPLSLSRYYPELAKSISQSGASIIVTLQPGERWTNDKPVTSQDVLDAFLIDGVGGGNSVWDHLSSVVAPNPGQVVFTMKPGFPARQLIPDIDSIIPLPSSQYGKLLPPNLQTSLLVYYSLYAQNPTSASSSVVGKMLARLNQKIIDYSPSQFISDGPYQVVSINTSEILLKKWHGFWAARNFPIPTMRFVVLGSNDAVYPAMLNGEFDETLVGMPKLIIEQAEKHKNLTVFQSGLSTTVTGLFYNTRRYPFNMTGVRQALAEMINRAALVEDVWGTFKHGVGGAVPLTYPSPISPVIQDSTLTKSQVATLNPYTYNLAKATATLRTLGFKQGPSGWLMPNGQPFDATIVVPSGWSDNDLAAVYLATLLSGLGIHVQVQEPEYDQFYSDLTGGNFDLTYFWTSCCLITNPLQELTLPLENYDYSSPSQPGLGVGPVVDVPGIGSVNIPQAIAEEASNVPLGTSQFANLVYDWVKWFNGTLPVYDIAAQPDNLSVYSDTRFTDWPPLSSPIFETQTQGSQGVIILAMQEGYIRPR